MIEIHERAGMLLENYLNQMCEFLNNMGFHAHKNNAMRNYAGKFIKGEPFDYELFINGKVYCFDAKENMSYADKWKVLLTGNRGHANERILKQAINLLNCKRNGADAFFLVAFGKGAGRLPFSLVKFDAELVYNAIMNRTRFLMFDQGTEFDINKILNQKG